MMAGRKNPGRVMGFFQDFRVFLKNVLLLFRQNFRVVLQFILLCGVFNAIVTTPLKNALGSLLMRAGCTTYITPVNLQEVLLNPGSVLVLFLFGVVISFLALLEIAGLLHAFSMGQIGRKTTLAGMLSVGIQSCAKALLPRNWPLVLFLMVLFPLTKLMPLSNSTFKLILPGFVNQTIAYTKSLRILYAFGYAGLLVLCIVYIFSINTFVLQKADFRTGCRHSRRLIRGKWLSTLLTMALLRLLILFAINSVASILVINAREVANLFLDSGVVSRSADVGTYTYVLRMLLNGLFGPAINNAALTVLFFRYIEEKDQLVTLSRDVFRERRVSRGVAICFHAAVLALLVFDIGMTAKRYSFLAEPVSVPYVCAHRGDNVNAPENTMPAFALAAQENLPWIELDVHQTADGVIVCSHDPSLARVTGEDLSIHEHTWEELSRCEMGDWMPGDYEHVTIPTLEEVLRLARENGMRVQVELKGHPDDVDFEENVLRVIEDAGMHDRVMIICLDARRVMRVQELDPSILKAYCMVVALGHLEDIEYTDNVSIEETNVTPELVHRLHEAGMQVFCWTVDLEDTLQYLVSCDVDVIGTDNPTMVKAALSRLDYSGGIPRAFHILMNTIAGMEK